MVRRAVLVVAFFVGETASFLTVHVKKGRDLIEIEKAMEFDCNACIWRVAGDAVPVRRSAECTAVLEAIASPEDDGPDYATDFRPWLIPHPRA